MIYTNVKRGADPELFLQDASNKYISAVGRIGGSKWAPLAIDDDGSAIQEDNVAVEFNIIPAATKDDFVKNISKVLKHLHTITGQMGLYLRPDASALFDADQLDSPQAKEFGCEADFNAWLGGTQNPKPVCPAGLENLRTCGGHLHLSWSNPNDLDRIRLMQAHDIFVAVPSVLYDSDNRRRKLYGCAGAFRPKDYGAEYRVCSNFWIQSQQTTEWLYEQSEKAIDFLNNGGEIKWEDYSLVVAAVNHGDRQAVNQIIKNYNVE